MTLEDAIEEVRRLPSPEVMRQLLRYEPDTGKLFWLRREERFFSDTGRRSAAHACSNWNARYAGKEAFTSVDRHGYRCGSVFNHSIFAHRVAWALVHGAFPEGEIDHRNGNPSDNRLANLRAATRAENVHNQGLRSDNTSGHKGVSWKKERRVWEAHIKLNGKQQRIGSYPTAQLAAEAYAKANAALHGIFGRTT